MFSDEMMIVLKPDGKLKVWRKVAEKRRPECLGYMRECQGSTLKLMVWGCVDLRTTIFYTRIADYNPKNAIL
jgi:hypothetical protein